MIIIPRMPYAGLSMEVSSSGVRINYWSKPEKRSQRSLVINTGGLNPAREKTKSYVVPRLLRRQRRCALA